jgi:hypothetical protein
VYSPIPFSIESYDNSGSAVIVSLPPSATFDESNVIPVGSSDCEVEKHGDETEDGKTLL